MSTTHPSAVAPDEVFLRHDHTVAKGRWLIVGGIAALLVAAGGMVLAIVASVNQFALHAMTTMPVLLGLGALMSGITMLRTATQVAVGPGGLTVIQSSGMRRYAWSEVGWATVMPQLMGAGKQLIVYDSQGKTIVRLGDAFDNFDRLTELMTHYVATRGDATADQIQRKKSFRAALLSVAVGCGLLTAAVGVAWMTYSDDRAVKLLAEQGQPGEGQIVERFLAPDGRTPRLRYQVNVDGKLAPERNAELNRPYWDSLEGETTVPVIYVPSAPSISRAEGEVIDDDLTKTPLGGYGLAAAGGLLGLGMLALSAMQFAGLDLDLDSKTGKLSIKRYGTGR